MNLLSRLRHRLFPVRIAEYCDLCQVRHATSPFDFRYSLCHGCFTLIARNGLNVPFQVHPPRRRVRLIHTPPVAEASRSLPIPPERVERDAPGAAGSISNAPAPSRQLGAEA